MAEQQGAGHLLRSRLHNGRNSAVPYATDVFAVAQNFVVQQKLTNFLDDFNIGTSANLIIES